MDSNWYYVYENKYLYVRFVYFWNEKFLEFTRIKSDNFSLETNEIDFNR